MIEIAAFCGNILLGLGIAALSTAAAIAVAAIFFGSRD